MIRIKNLFLRYVRQYYALYDITLDIEMGESVAFIGENGSGKTSLIRILTKLEQPTKGEVYIKNIPLKKIDFAVDLSMGYLPKNPVFFYQKTVYDNLIYVLKLQKLSERAIENAINDILIEFNIERLKDVKVSELSYFEQQLVAIARLTLKKRDIVIVDEILDTLSLEEQERVIEIFNKRFINKDSVFIIATCKEDLVKPLCKRKVYFENGSIIKEKSKK